MDQQIAGELGKNIAQMGVGMIPIAGTGIQATWETDDLIKANKDNPYYDPTQARIVAGVRAIAGAGTDLVGGTIAKAVNLAGLGGLGMAAGGGGALMAGQKDLGKSLAEGADYLNPDSWVRKGMYSLLPGADPEVATAKLEAQKQKAQVAYDDVTTAGNELYGRQGPRPTLSDTWPRTETAPVLTQTPPTEQAAIQKADQDISTSPKDTSPLYLQITPDNIDQMIAGSGRLKQALQDSRVSVDYNMG